MAKGHSNTTRARGPAAGSVLAWAGAAAITAGPACTATRTPPTMACTGNQHCPADGKWECDLAQQRCVPCVGTCSGAQADAGTSDVAVDAADAATSTADTAAAVDSGGDAAADGAAADAAADTATDSADGEGPPPGSCAGKCGEYVGTSVCNCDDECETYGDCCADYATVCPQGGHGDASDDVEEPDVLPNDSTSTAD